MASPKLRLQHLHDPIVLAATGGGSGLVPIAPGTAGSAVGVALWWFLLADLGIAWQAGIVGAAFVLGVLAAEGAVQRYSLGDEPAIVVDEMVGCAVALLAVPKSWPWVLAAFVLFRVADIAKPWPIGWADRNVSGGLGIMLDDLLAGLLVAAILGGVRLALALVEG